MDRAEESSGINSQSLKKQKGGGRLTILEKKGIEVVRDGKVLSNDELLNRIKVPERIQRKFTIARDYDEQTRSCERLT